MLGHGNTSIIIVAIDGRVELIACNTTAASSTFQVLEEGRQEVEFFLAVAFDGELWSLVLARSFVLFVGGGIDEMFLALFTPEIEFLHLGKLDGGQGLLLILHNLPVANDVVALAGAVIGECGFIAEVGAACNTLIPVKLYDRALVVRKFLKGQERLAAPVTFRAETVTGTSLVSLPGGRIGEDLQAG